MVDPASEERASLERRYQAAQQRVQALYDLSALINSTREIDPIVELLLSQVRQVFAADRAAVFLQNADGELRPANTVGLSEEYVASVRASYRQAAGGAAMIRRAPVYVPDVLTDPIMTPLREAAVREGFRSMVVVPFMHEDQALGALTLYFDQPHVYEPDDLAVLTTFANQVAVALANARLFTEAARQVRRAGFLVEAGRLLNSSLEIDQVLHALSRAVTDVLGEACAIYLLHRNEEELSLAAYADTLPADNQDRLTYLQQHPPRLGVGGIGEVALHTDTRLVDAAHPATDSLDPYREGFGAHAYLVTALLAQQRLIGTVVVWLFDPRLTFSSDDIRLLDALGDQAAVALENARLYERERRAQQAKDEFLSSVSHELRTPLTAIIGYTQLIRKSARDESSPFRQQVDIIWSQAQRLNRLVDSLLDISNIEEGQLALDLHRLDLWNVVRLALDRVQVSSRPGLRFEIEAETDNCWVQGDAARLSQVFEHLITNAMKYSPANGLVTVHLSQAGGRAVVQIRDSGPGLTPAQLGQLFQRYYQAETPLNRTGGLGLGLYISRAIIEAHGGTISASNAFGGGAAFQVTLPAETT